MTNIINGISTEQMSHVIRLLVQLGKIALKNAHLNDWIDCQTASDICRQHNLKFDGRFLTAHELEAVLRVLFQTQDEIYADCVNVIGYERRVGWDLVFEIRFYRHSPHWTSPTPAGVLPRVEEQDETALDYNDDHDCGAVTYDDEMESVDPTEVSL